MSAAGTEGTGDDGPGGAPFRPERLETLYHESRHEQLADEFLVLLERFDRLDLAGFGRDGPRVIDVFCKHFLHLFTQPAFTLDRQRGLRFVTFNHVIANLVALSSFRTTDAWLPLLLAQQGNFFKLLTLYNARCTTRIPHGPLFDIDADTASVWYFCFFQNYRTVLAEEQALAHMRQHMRSVDPRLEVPVVVANKACFGVTYMDPDHDHLLKRHVNARLQAWEPCRVPIVNRPDPRRIAVLSAYWFAGHSVHRCMHAFVERLACDYELTLVQLGPNRPDIDRGPFAGGVIRCQVDNRPPDLSMFTPNDFALAFYPDIGMSVESVVLSNLRIAPIQLCGYGHPVSTHGSRIDYWLGGRDVEDADHAARNYSERLVLIPGAGVAPLRPDYRPGKVAPSTDDRILVGCPWIAHKTNADLLALLAEILARAGRPVTFHVFSGLSTRVLELGPFKAALLRQLGAEQVHVHAFSDYQTYMQALEACHFCLDSWPFGGYATVIDALWLRKPVITVEGHRFFNRSAAHLLRTVGLDELVAGSPQAFVELALTLIGQPERLRHLKRRLAAVDLERTLFAEEHADAFRRAIGYLLENHERLAADTERTPIVIE